MLLMQYRAKLGIFNRMMLQTLDGENEDRVRTQSKPRFSEHRANMSHGNSLLFYKMSASSRLVVMPDVTDVKLVSDSAWTWSASAARCMPWPAALLSRSLRLSPCFCLRVLGKYVYASRCMCVNMCLMKAPRPCQCKHHARTSAVMLCACLGLDVCVFMSAPPITFRPTCMIRSAHLGPHVKICFDYKLLNT